jgi:lysylphosphatidylglycerol synthetase-like protein (DUF2156 family)
VQFGGPFAPPSHYLSLLRAFLEFAQQQQRTVVAVQLQRRDAEQYAREGFTVNQIGSSYVVDLDTFTLQGTRFMRLRNKISRALRTGLEVVEADAEAWHDRMRDLDREWLGAKGEHAQELEFLVGQYGGAMQKHRRLFAATVEGRLVAYITYSPVYGSRPGWLHDLSRRLPGGTPGVMEAINRTAIEAFRREGVRWLHFGFTPFTGLDDSLELAGRSVAFSRFMSLLWQHGEAVYPARTQLAYKEKWAPSTVLTEYVAFHGPASVAAFAHIFRACNAF